MRCNIRCGIATAFVVFALAAGCSSGPSSEPPRDDRSYPPGTIIKDIDRHFTVTFCDHGNRVYRGESTIAVVPGDPSCAEPVR